MEKQDSLIKLYNKTNKFGALLGMELEVHEPGFVTYCMIVKEEHQAIPLVAHGGVVAALIDGTLGVAGLSLAALENKVVSTVEFKVNYLKPAKVNDELRCSGKVLNAGKRLIYIEAEVKNQADEVIAKANGTFNKYPAVTVFSSKSASNH